MNEAQLADLLRFLAEQDVGLATGQPELGGRTVQRAVEEGDVAEALRVVWPEHSSEPW